MVIAGYYLQALCFQVPYPANRSDEQMRRYAIFEPPLSVRLTTPTREVVDVEKEDSTYDELLDVVEKIAKKVRRFGLRLS